MSNPSQETEVRQAKAPEPELTLLDYVAAVWRHRWLVVGLCFVTVLVTFVLTIRMQKIYEATGTILAPKESVGGLGLLSSLASVSGLQVPGMSSSAGAPNRDMLVGILKSRTVAAAAAERFQLRDRYQSRYAGDAIRMLQDMASSGLAVSKEGVISVKIEDTDPTVAAAIANFYLEEVDRLVSMYNTSQAGRQFGFISTQLASARSGLERAEQAFRSFQERNRAIVLQDQTRVAIEGAAQLTGQIMAMEVQLQVMRNFATDANPDVVAAVRRIEEMKRQLSKLQYGDGVVGQSPRGQEGRDFVVPFAKVPEVGIQLARVTRELKIQQTLVEVLTQQLEESRINEARNLPTVQVLDRPVPPERPSRPRLLLNLALAGMGSLFFGIALASFLDYLKKARQSWPGRSSPNRT